MVPRLPHPCVLCKGGRRSLQLAVMFRLAGIVGHTGWDQWDGWPHPPLQSHKGGAASSQSLRAVGGAGPNVSSCTSRQVAPASKRLVRNQILQENQDAILVQAGGERYKCLLRLRPYPDPGGNDGLQCFIGGRSKTARAPTLIRFGPAVWACGYGSRGESQLFRSGWKFGHAVSQQPGFTVRPGYSVLREHASFHRKLLHAHDRAAGHQR